MTVEEVEVPVAVEPPKKSFSLEILRLIRDWQQQHGIRFGDYQRYRGYCTRRLARVRKVLKLPQAEKRHFKKRDVTTAHLTGPKADVRYLHVPLMMAERAWAFALALRQESNTEPRKRFHLIAKLRKACAYALQLQELCNNEVCDARTKLEAEAYSAWLHGTLQFELGLFQTASENLKKAEIVYQNLADALPEEERTLYEAKVAELLPSLRYCAYRIGEGKDGDKNMDDLMEFRAQGMDIDNLNTLVAQTKTESTDALQTMDWRGRKVTVRPEKVRLFLLSIQEVDKTVEKAKTTQDKIEIIETVIMGCRDSIQAVKDEISQDPKLRATANDPNAGLVAVPGILYLLAHLKFTRLIFTIERNLLLVKQTKQSLDAPQQADNAKQQQQQLEMNKKVRPQDMTRLYEIILQNVGELQTVQGMEQDAEYQAEMEGLNLSFKAFRCYYIAVTLVALKRWKEAVALYQRSTVYAEQVTKDKAMKQLPFNLPAELKELLEKIAGSVYTAQAYSVLEEEDEPQSVEEGIFGAKSQKNTKPLYERLSAYREDPQLNSKNPNVFKLTPDMEPIPCKPLFFDLALNYVEFPSLEHKMDQGAKGGAEEGKGISGLVKGFLGWGGKK